MTSATLEPGLKATFPSTHNRRPTSPIHQSQAPAQEIRFPAQHDASTTEHCGLDFRTVSGFLSRPDRSLH